jgi:hypothetical protein
MSDDDLSSILIHHPHEYTSWIAFGILSQGGFFAEKRWKRRPEGESDS